MIGYSVKPLWKARGIKQKIMEEKIIKQWTTKEKVDDGDSYKIVETYLNTVSQIGNFRVYRSELLEDGQPVSLEIAEPQPKALVISDMTKGEYRGAVAMEVQPRTPEEIARVDEAVQRAVRFMRRTFGALNYTRENVQIAVKIYNNELRPK